MYFFNNFERRKSYNVKKSTYFILGSRIKLILYFSQILEIFSGIWACLQIDTNKAVEYLAAGNVLEEIMCSSLNFIFFYLWDFFHPQVQFICMIHKNELLLNYH